MSDKHPLDEHVRLIKSFCKERGFYVTILELRGLAAAVLRVELEREPSEEECMAACIAFTGIPIGPCICAAMRTAIKAARASRRKALGIDT